jgi:hypothetical protein
MTEDERIAGRPTEPLDLPSSSPPAPPCSREEFERQEAQMAELFTAGYLHGKKCLRRDLTWLLERYPDVALVVPTFHEELAEMLKPVPVERTDAK